MGNLFNLENPFFTALSKLVDMFFISLMWFICCIPIVTIVPATTALYYTTVKVIRRERGYISREYFRSFKQNFKTGTLSGIILLLVTLLLFWDRYLTKAMEGNSAFIFFTIFNALILIVFLGSVFICPVLSRFTVGVKNLFKTSFFMAMRHLPTTILVAAIILAASFILYIFPILLCIVPALACLLISFLVEKVLKKYMPEKSEDAEANGIDQWYLE